MLSGYGAVTVWERDRRTVFDLKGHTEPVWSVAFSPDGKRLVSAAGRWGVQMKSDPTPGDGEVKVWDTATGVELLTVRESDQTAFGVAFSPDGRWFGIAGRDKKIRLWDLKPDRGPADAPPVRPPTRPSPAARNADLRSRTAGRNSLFHSSTEYGHAAPPTSCRVSSPWP